MSDHSLDGFAAAKLITCSIHLFSSREFIFAENGSAVDFKTFNPYSSVSNIDEINAAIAYQKAAASMALVVDLASAGFVELS